MKSRKSYTIFIILISFAIELFCKVGHADEKNKADGKNIEHTIIKSPEILNSDEKELAAAAAKITYHGEQTKPIRSLMFRTQDFNLKIEQFTKLQDSPDIYNNDDLGISRDWVVTPQQISKSLAAVKKLLLRPKSPPDKSFISFTVIRELKGQILGYEFWVSRNDGLEFYEKLLNSFPAEYESKSGPELLKFQKENLFPSK